MRILVTLAALLSLAACGGSDDSADVAVFKYIGTISCGSGGGISLATMQSQLAAANVQSSSYVCGTDGKAAPGVCDIPDGKIRIFQIHQEQVAAAGAAGFAPLTTLPAAKAVPCQ